MMKTIYLEIFEIYVYCE